MTSPTNKKTFNLYLNNTVTFILRIADFATNLTLVTLIHINNIVISATLKMLGKISTTISIPKTTITIAVTGLLGRIVSNIAINTLTLANTMHSLQRVVQTISSHNTIVFVSRSLLRGIVSISGGHIGMVLSPIVAVLYKLSDWDGSTLATLDVMLLSALDHS